MCPACIASAALTAGAVITAGGLTTLVKIFHPKKGAKKNGLDNTTHKEK